MKIKKLMKFKTKLDKNSPEDCGLLKYFGNSWGNNEGSKRNG